ncbi:hypothetical protein [Ralstonia mojiangensis]|uniref:hypothetical protein n=1 Tax=Ralstonia mojiangensis TaxID=2953895 RepID=UPI002090CC47|nr:hypothetical protein [Ralstonia mojiangensis]MCO5411950.1 hypothetical protein [Ralstonia mojiangensis]
MGGETGAIAKMAVRVSDDIFEWFRWSRVKLPDQNFDCVKTTAHAPNKDSHTHPVDAVFWYLDPYLNKIIYLNTDLKSYASGSIDANRIFSALKSLALTIDCARVSEEWQDRYHTLGDIPYEVRGMLFVYNHDSEFDKTFYDLLSSPVKRRGASEKRSVKLETLPIADGQLIHLFEPGLISYLTTVVTDAQRLHSDGTFPEKNYEFFYPDLRLHKASGAEFERAATAELLAGPYLIIRHDQVKKLNESTGDIEVRFPEGYVIYYNRPGASAEEFAYFLDVLSGYQILDGQHKIRIRIAHRSIASDPRSNFRRAISLYAQEWGFDGHKLSRLESIEVEVVEIYQYSFSRTDIGWER